jgi:hypothetical protein
MKGPAKELPCVSGQHEAGTVDLSEWLKANAAGDIAQPSILCDADQKQV